MKKLNKIILSISLTAFASAAFALPVVHANPLFAEEIGDFGDDPRLQTMSFFGDSKTQMGFCYTTSNVTSTDLEVLEASVYDGSNGFDDVSVKDKVKSFTGTIEASKISGDGFIHRVNAKGLNPDTKYYYRFGDKSIARWCEIGTFKTSADSNRNFSFAHISDPQGDNELHYESYNQLLNDMTHDQNPEWIALTGDITDDSHFGGTIDLHEWDLALTKQWPILKNYPVAAVSGNHDGALHAFSSRYNYDVPEGSDISTGQYYSFDYQGVHFTCLNSNDTSDPKDPNATGLGDAQLAWCEQDLLAHKDDKFLIVMMHKGMFDAGGHSCNDDRGDYDIEKMRRQLAPMFTKYGVDLVLEGHDHLFNLSYPMVAEEYIGQDSYYHIDENYRYSYRDFDQYGLKNVYTFSDLEGTFYFNTGTASGQKYYAPVIGGSMEDTIFKASNPNQKMYTMVDVLDKEILLRTYLCTSNGTSLYQTFAIAHDKEGTPTGSDDKYNTDFVVEGDYSFEYNFSRYNHSAKVSMKIQALAETETNLAAKFKGEFECDGGLGRSECLLYRNGHVKMYSDLALETDTIRFETTGNWHMDEEKNIVISLRNAKDAIETYVAKTNQPTNNNNNTVLIIVLCTTIPAALIAAGLITFFIIRKKRKAKKEA